MLSVYFWWAGLAVLLSSCCHDNFNFWHFLNLVSYLIPCAWLWEPYCSLPFACLWIFKLKFLGNYLMTSWKMYFLTVMSWYLMASKCAWCISESKNKNTCFRWVRKHLFQHSEQKSPTDDHIPVFKPMHTLSCVEVADVADNSCLWRLPWIISVGKCGNGKERDRRKSQSG